MTISDQELREMVREAISKHLQGGRESRGTSPSHQLLPVEAGSEGDGACLIEPAVRCNHCGYCQSYGH